MLFDQKRGKGLNLRNLNVRIGDSILPRLSLGTTSGISPDRRPGCELGDTSTRRPTGRPRTFRPGRRALPPKPGGGGGSTERALSSSDARTRWPKRWKGPSPADARGQTDQQRKQHKQTAGQLVAAAHIPPQTADAASIRSLLLGAGGGNYIADSSVECTP